MLDTPAIAQLVPRLQPEVLHRVIQNCGLEDSSELVALATSDQLTRVFDLDLWTAGQPGRDETFDVDRFGVWLGVLLECGADVAARKLAGMDAEIVIAGISRYVRVLDPAASSPAVSADGDEWEPPPANDGVEFQVGGYQLVARRHDCWDVIVATLIALDAERPLFFHRVMRECRRLSNAGFELDRLDDLLDDDDQVMFDVALGRERRRDAQGYVTPAEARAFLQMARHLELGKRAAPPSNPLARAYFRAVESPASAEPRAESKRLPSASELDAGAAPESPPSPPSPDQSAIAAIVGMLQEAGVVPASPRALLGDAPAEATRLALMREHMQIAGERDALAWTSRHQEMAYLANAIMTGCAIQGRPFTAQEASDAVVAVCNLGLENWPLHWLDTPARGNIRAAEGGTRLPGSFLVDHDLVAVFQVGWAVLHDKVCMFAARRLISLLAQLRCDDREIKRGLGGLRRELKTHADAGMPWLAREAFEVIAILDMPAWAALLGLVDECPVMHAAIAASRNASTHAVSSTAFEFISENGQIASVHEFMQSLPDRLRG